MENIISAADQAEHLSASFAKRIASFEEQIAARTSQALEHAATYGELDGEQDVEVRHVVKKATRDQAKREAGKYRRDLATGTEAERTERLKQLMAIEAEASKVAPLYESPVQVLSRAGLGSAERSRYTEQLRNAGPRELVHMRDWALHNNDKILAAAVLSRLDTLPTKGRPFKAVEFADAVVGKEFKETREAIERIRVAAQRALNANRNFERGRVDATAKIAMGLATRSA